MNYIQKRIKRNHKKAKSWWARTQASRVPWLTKSEVSEDKWDRIQIYWQYLAGWLSYFADRTWFATSYKDGVKWSLVAGSSGILG